MRTRCGVVGVLGGVVAGMAGTAVMSTAARLRRRRYARRLAVSPAQVTRLLDYDDSEHVVIAASTVLGWVTGWSPRSSRQRRALFLLVHWGYGSVVGVGHVGLYRLIGREPAAAVAFFAGCEAMALTLFPVLGGTPVPWRWRRGLVATSVVQHALYAGTVAAVGAVQRDLSTARTREVG